MLIEIALTAVFIGLAFKLYQRPANFPPGPRGLPILGYIPFLNYYDRKYPFKSMKKMSDIYGPVVGFYMGPSQPFISVCGYEGFKQALHNDDLNGRPIFKIPMITDGKPRIEMGILNAVGELWQEHRRFSLRHLRDLGFGKSSIEDQIMDEIQELMHEIKTASSSDPGNVVNFQNIFNLSALNVLWAMICGKRKRRDDADFQSLLVNVDTVFRSGNSIRSLLNLPEFLYRKYPVLRKHFGIRSDLILLIEKYVLDTIEKHERNRCLDDQESNNYIDAFLDEMDRQKDKTSSTFSKEQLIATILDLLGAGSDATSNFIGFVILYILNYPQVQQKMQAELDDVCGAGLPSFTDRINLPYTEAVLMETQRLANVAPTTAPHCALKDTQIMGRTIPKGSTVLINLYSVHIDPSFWKDPEVFQPERHLNNEGKIIKTDHLLGFGVGKRQCMGESLARITTYLFTTALIKTFEFKPLPDQPMPSLEPRNGFTLAYEGFKAVVVPRT